MFNKINDLSEVHIMYSFDTYKYYKIYDKIQEVLFNNAAIILLDEARATWGVKKFIQCLIQSTYKY